MPTPPVGRNKPVRATARTGVSGKHSSLFAGNTTSRYALGWPYSGLRLGSFEGFRAFCVFRGLIDLSRR
ncbi:MAG TPA: hypothetical protein VIF37_05355 [Methylobacter sp.]